MAHAAGAAAPAPAAKLAHTHACEVHAEPSAAERCVVSSCLACAERAQPNVEGDAEGGARCLRMGAFISLLLANYLVTHALASGVHLPSDGRATWLAGDLAGDLLRLMELGVVLGWLVRIDDAARAAWFVSSKRHLAVLLLLFFATPPVLSALNGVPGLSHSVATSAEASAWTPPLVGTFAVVAAAVCCAVAWHVRHARAVLPRAAYRAYLATRLAILAAYCAAMAAVSVAYDAGRELRHGHLHHLYVGVVVASFARFNHPFSGALLALGAGVFVQGVGAYGFAPLLTEAGCQVIRMSVPMAKRLAEAAHCQWSEALVGGVTHLNFNMCPTDGVSLRAALHGQCGAQP